MLAVLLLGGAAPAAGLAGIADWLSVTAAAEMVYGTCGDNVTWSYETEAGVLTISGTGDMADYYSNDYSSYNLFRAPWSSYQTEINAVIINSGVTSIGR